MNGDDSAKSPLSELEELREQLRKLEEERDKEKAETEKEKEKAREELKMKDQQIAKLRTQIRGNSGYIAEGTITWPVEVKDMGLEKEAELFSPPVIIGGVPFRLGTYQQDFGLLGLPRIAFHPYLYCCPDTPVFTHNVEGECTVRLVSSVKENEARSGDFWFCRTNCAFDGDVMGCFFWDDVMNPANGFLHDGRITFEAELKVLCNYKNVYADFLTDSPLSDVTLVVEGQKFHSNKAFLAHHCGFFKALFFSNFSEKDKKEVELKDIKSKEFEDFLRAIYPERGEISAFNVAAMLHLADYFDAYSVRQACKYFLMRPWGGPFLSDVEKLLLSEEFGLFEMQQPFVDMMAEGDKGFEVIRRAIKSDKFKDLPERLQVLLLQKHAWLAGMELAVASKQ